MTKQTHPLDSLFFMGTKKPKSSGRDFWAIEPSGNYTEDNRRGEQCAFEYIELLLKHGNPRSLQSVVLDMAEKNTDMHSEESHIGLIVGFFSALEDVLSVAVTSEHVFAVRWFNKLQQQKVERKIADMKKKRSKAARKAANTRWGKLRVVK